MLSHLPDEILIQILVRLSVKSLLRFRSVSRSWNSLITSQPFIGLHLSHSIEAAGGTNTDSSSIFLRHYSHSRRRQLNTVYRDYGGESLAEDQELEFPIKTYDTYYYVGACNGLICLADYLINHLRVVLWNPSIRTCFRVPIPRLIDTDNAHIYTVGFGFDRRTGQYKVMRMIYAVSRNYERLIPPEVEVYVLGSDRWRSIDCHVPYLVPESSPQAFFCGGIHWVGCREDQSMVIVVFNVQEEVFQEIEIPRSIRHRNMHRLSVCSHRDSLYLLENDPWRDGKFMLGVFDIWVMEYGVKESWTKQFSIDVRGERGGGLLKRVLGFRKEGKILAVNEEEELISYDKKGRRVNQHGIRGLAKSFEAIPHLECLVLLKGTDGFDGQMSSCS
ncbi:hypothetical protein SAY86_031076 [Trapa natans]|uniref:F-box domain-containing protein n=1 Tax=Trapa natans TaxID=22666 RepID=A0AAN7M3X1_TRANT|nr:hypothetical protein SAY86_031076 [Trapa natans]